jgi:alkylhydroperoxidase/carboxymuconolactone decarboxylase family protein YurZ
VTATDRAAGAAMDRHSRGQREYEPLIGSPSAKALAELRLRSPQLDEAVVEAFDGSLAHAELERAARGLATVAILAAGRAAERQLATHAKAALGTGLAPSELLALCREHVAKWRSWLRLRSRSRARSWRSRSFRLSHRWMPLA